MDFTDVTLSAQNLNGICHFSQPSQMQGNKWTKGFGSTLQEFCYFVVFLQGEYREVITEWLTRYFRSMVMLNYWSTKLLGRNTIPWKSKQRSNTFYFSKTTLKKYNANFYISVRTSSVTQMLLRIKSFHKYA